MTMCLFFFFFNVLRLVMEKLDDLTAMKTTQDYIWYCQEGIHHRILEKGNTLCES